MSLDVVINTKADLGRKLTDRGWRRAPLCRKWKQLRTRVDIVINGEEIQLVNEFVKTCNIQDIKLL